MPDRQRLAQILMTAITIASFVLEGAQTNLLKPLWHPHAKFHGALLLFMLVGVSATACWLLWRKSSEPEIAVRVAACLSLPFWTPLFYTTSLIPRNRGHPRHSPTYS